MSSISKLVPEDLQTLLISRGYDLGSFGADGIWGGKTRAALEGWFGRGEDLLKIAPPPTPSDSILPASWLPDCKMIRIIGHWSAGVYKVSDIDKEHYHFIVGGDLVVVRGDNSIKANVSSSDGDGYAAHTAGINSGSIGIAVAAMANAIENPFNPGSYPVTKGQFLVLAQIAAECCRKYNIAVTPKTVLMHGEVQKNLGKPQNGKWDICKLPWEPTWSSAKVCDTWREEVQARV